MGGEALTTNPNLGGFGQEDKDLVLQDPNRVYAALGVCFSLFISQLSFVLKKKQFEKVQFAEVSVLKGALCSPCVVPHVATVPQIDAWHLCIFFSCRAYASRWHVAA